MKTTLDALTLLYSLLKVTSVNNEISGAIYKDERPSGSIKEDVVINTITSSPGDITNVSCNVNIYCNDINGKINGQIQNLPDYNRLDKLADLIIPLLDNISGDNYLIYIESQASLADKENHQHYLNIRVRVTYELSY